MPKVSANGLNFHYQQSGAGPDVILIHGVTGDLSIWFLCQAMGTLGQSFRVTAYDLRGHGYSDLAKSGYTSAELAATLSPSWTPSRSSERCWWVIASARWSRFMPRCSSPIGSRRVVLSDPCFRRAASSGGPEPMGPLAEFPRGSRPGRGHAFRRTLV